MTPTPRFLLDANVFMEAARRYYAFDLLPQFWEVLIEQAKQNRVLSIDRVKLEIERGKDDLACWAKGEFSFAFASTNHPDVLTEFRNLMGWVNAQPKFFDSAKEEFAKGVDGWLVAFAKVDKMTLVTHEQSKPESRNRVMIPDVCNVAGVPCVDTFQMLRALGVRFA
jgi:hypothetical protein